MYILFFRLFFGRSSLSPPKIKFLYLVRSTSYIDIFPSVSKKIVSFESSGKFFIISILTLFLALNKFPFISPLHSHKFNLFIPKNSQVLYALLRLFPTQYSVTSFTINNFLQSLFHHFLILHLFNLFYKTI